MDKTKYFGPREKDQRLALPENRRTFEVSKIWEVHHEIIRRLLLGQKNVDIAKALNISEAVVSYTRNSKIVQDKLEIMKGARDAETIDLAKRIRENAPKSLKLLEDIIDGMVEGPDGERAVVPLNMRRREANTMLDRAGYGATKTFRAEHLVGHFTKDEIDEIKERAKSAGTIVDVEVVKDA